MIYVSLNILNSLFNTIKKQIDAGVEKLKRKSPLSSTTIRGLSIPVGHSLANPDHPRMIPLYDKDGKRLGCK